MADEKETEPKKGKNKLLVLILVGNLLVISGAGVAVYLAFSGDAQAESSEEEEGEESPPETLGPLVEIAGLVVNLDEQNSNRFLRAAFQAEVGSPEEQEELTARMVPLRNSLFLHLSGLRVDALQGQENRAQLLEDLKTTANETLGGDMINNLYFSEFVIQ